MWFPDYPKAKVTSGVCWNNSNSELFYVDQNNNINRIFWNGTNWSYNVITRRTLEHAALKLFYTNNRLYYINGTTIQEITFAR
jgi:hypothetical protein